MARLITNKIYVKSPSRSGQLNEGADHASGDYLIFLHVDTYINERALDEILGIDNDFNWGFFKIKLDDPRLKYKFLSCCINLRSKIFSYSTEIRCLLLKEIYFMKSKDILILI